MAVTPPHAAQILERVNTLTRMQLQVLKMQATHKEAIDRFPDLLPLDRDRINRYGDFLKNYRTAIDSKKAAYIRELNEWGYGDLLRSQD